jgi:hypothetical protein
MMMARQAIAAGLIGDPLDLELQLNIYTPGQLFPFLAQLPRIELLVHSILYFDSQHTLIGTPKGEFARSVPDLRAPGFAQTRTSMLLDYGDLRRGVMTIDQNHYDGRKFQLAGLRIEGNRAAAAMVPMQQSAKLNGSSNRSMCGTVSAATACPAGPITGAETLPP